MVPTTNQFWMFLALWCQAVWPPNPWGVTWCNPVTRTLGRRPTALTFCQSALDVGHVSCLLYVDQFQHLGMGQNLWIYHVTTGIPIRQPAILGYHAVPALDPGFLKPSEKSTQIAVTNPGWTTGISRWAIQGSPIPYQYTILYGLVDEFPHYGLPWSPLNQVESFPDNY